MFRHSALAVAIAFFQLPIFSVQAQTSSDCYNKWSHDKSECRDAPNGENPVCMKDAENTYSGCIADINRAPSDVCNTLHLQHGHAYALKNGGSVMCP